MKTNKALFAKKTSSALFAVYFAVFVPLSVFAQEVDAIPEVEPVVEVVAPSESAPIVPEVAPEPELEIVPMPEVIPKTTPEITLDEIVSEPEIAPVVVSTPTANPEVAQFTDISVGTAYSSVGGAFSVNFNTLPKGQHTLSITPIRLTPEEVAVTGALSDVAYDVTSDMTDGSFT